MKRTITYPDGRVEILEGHPQELHDYDKLTRPPAESKKDTQPQSEFGKQVKDALDKMTPGELAEAIRKAKQHADEQLDKLTAPFRCAVCKQVRDQLGRCSCWLGLRQPPMTIGTNDQPCAFDNLPPGVYGLVCTCPRCSPHVLTSLSPEQYAELPEPVLDFNKIFEEGQKWSKAFMERTKDMDDRH